MSNSTSLLALKAPYAMALLGQQGILDRRTRKQVEKHIIQMLRVAEESKAAQDAVSAIYAYSLWKSDATLTAAELIKAMRSPLLSLPELDTLDDALRKQYIDLVERIATHGAEQILRQLNR